MSKMPKAICPKCSNPIYRHDPNRIRVKVARGTRGEGVFKELHLKCYQEVTNDR